MWKRRGRWQVWHAPAMRGGSGLGASVGANSPQLMPPVDEQIRPWQSVFAQVPRVPRLVVDLGSSQQGSIPLGPHDLWVTLLSGFATFAGSVVIICASIPS